MNIGQAASASGVSAKMIRHYEAIGLIGEATRTASGYRVYTGHDVHTLSFIRRARDLGFSVPEIRDLLALWRDQDRASADVKRIALQRVEALRAKMREIEAITRTLLHLAEHCNGDDRPDCPIIEGLAQDECDVAATVPAGSSRRKLINAAA
jgi:MerR family copper efflux transcriptional regulator